MIFLTSFWVGFAAIAVVFVPVAVMIIGLLCIGGVIKNPFKRKSR